MIYNRGSVKPQYILRMEHSYAVIQNYVDYLMTWGSINWIVSEKQIIKNMLQK